MKRVLYRLVAMVAQAGSLYEADTFWSFEQALGPLVFVFHGEDEGRMVELLWRDRSLLTLWEADL